MTPPRRTPEGTSPQDATPASSPVAPRKAPGVKDVAALAGVSVGSVSNVINRRERVRPDVRERVEAAIAQLGYKPNPTAQALRRGTSPLRRKGSAKKMPAPSVSPRLKVQSPWHSVSPSVCSIAKR